MVLRGLLVEPEQVGPVGGAAWRNKTGDRLPDLDDEAGADGARVAAAGHHAEHHSAQDQKPKADPPVTLLGRGGHLAAPRNSCSMTIKAVRSRTAFI